MGLGRRAAVACVVGLLALAAIGCGATERINDPRPQVASRVSVTIGADEITVTPSGVGLGPDKYQQLPQNQNHSQPPIPTKVPLTVVFVVSNQTDRNSQLEIRGPKDASSGPMVAGGPGSYQTELPTGAYTIHAAGIPGASPVSFKVGPYRASSENDVLLPSGKPSSGHSAPAKTAFAGGQ